MHPVTPRVTWVLSLGLLCHHVTSYSTGAPGRACSYMTPGHIAPHRRGDSSVFQLAMDKSTYIPWEVVEVSIVSNDTVFLGFLLKADNADDLTKSVGFFEPVNGCKWTCGGMAALTHKDPSSKTALTFTWRAPMSGSARVVFRLTVVTHYDELDYVDIRSDLLLPTPTKFKTKVIKTGTTTTAAAATTTTLKLKASSPSMTAVTSGTATTRRSNQTTPQSLTTAATATATATVTTTESKPVPESGTTASPSSSLVASPLVATTPAHEETASLLLVTEATDKTASMSTSLNPLSATVEVRTQAPPAEGSLNEVIGGRLSPGEQLTPSYFITLPMLVVFSFFVERVLY